MLSEISHERDKAAARRVELSKKPKASTETDIWAKVDAIADSMRRRFELRKLIMEGAKPFDMPSLRQMQSKCVIYNQNRRD